MFRRSVVRIHRILLERPLRGWDYGKLQPSHRLCTGDQFTSQLRDSNAQYGVRGYEIHTESDGVICVEKSPATRGYGPARKSSLLKRTAETAGSEFLKRSVKSKDLSNSVTVRSVVTDEHLVHVSSSSSEPNPRVDPGGELELFPRLKESGQEDEFADVGCRLQGSAIADDGEMEKRASAQAMALLEAALDAAEVEGGTVRKEDQLSLRVAIVGAPNAGKSLLTNKLVGTRVSAVSRKTNTTHREHLGVYTKGDTQLCFYDTPGLHLDIEGSPLRVDAQSRVQSAWQIVDTCEAVVVLVDAERQIRRPDRRVRKLVEKLGMEQVVDQKKILCLNKVDMIEQKRLLLPLAKEFESLPAFDRIFMISGLTGSGVKDVKDYLLQQAIASPWEEDAEYTNHFDIALEIVREQVFEHLHEELPHTTKQKLVSWKVLKDGSVRIQQLLLVAKKEHQKILVGKNGAVIGEIGIKARKELSTILGVNVHLLLDVKHMTGTE